MENLLPNHPRKIGRDRGENPGNARRVLDDVVNDQEIVRANGGEAYDEPDDEAYEPFAVLGALVCRLPHDAGLLSPVLSHGCSLSHEAMNGRGECTPYDCLIPQV